MKNISKKVIENFNIPSKQIRKYKDEKVEFSGEICYHCGIYVNVPRIRKSWYCYNCNTDNKFDPVNITVPFLDPDAGPTGPKLNVVDINDVEAYDYDW